jgi:carbonic anhydrase/acetyltransferase-like protein (isoleucine patch superfamily)
MKIKAAKKSGISRRDAERERVGRAFMRKWNRLLPLNEMLSDRWRKARLLGFGEGSSVYESAYVYGKPRVGKNVWIGPLTLIDATGGLEIGDGCDVSSGAQLLSHSTHLRCVSERRAETIKKKTVIGKHSFIGTNAVVLPGSRIGGHCVIAAGAVVDGVIPRFSVAAGVPARVIGRVLLSRGGARLAYKK